MVSTGKPTRMPKIVAFANQKGGAGKTTGAVHAADWLASLGHKIAFVDADGQESSDKWVEELGIPRFVIKDPEELFEELKNLTQKYDAVVVDSPGNASETTKAILQRAELVLIPCRDSVIDVKSTGKIIQFVMQAVEVRRGMPIAALYLSAVKEGTILLREAKEGLREGVLPLLETTVPDRQCIKDTAGQGNTVFRMKGKAGSAAALSYQKLFQEALSLFEQNAKWLDAK
jgi:chromosome partitioning protein